MIESRADKPITSIALVRGSPAGRDGGPARRVRRLHDAAGVTSTERASRTAAGRSWRSSGPGSSTFAPWFSASAVSPLLAEEWQTTGLDLPMLTVAVQVGRLP